MQWYINDMSSAGSFPDPGQGGPAESAKAREELEAREKVLKEREDKLEHEEQDAVNREKAVAERESNVESRESSIAKREAVTKQLVQEIGSREHALAERMQKLEERERSAAGQEGSEKAASGDSQVEDLQRQLRDAQTKLQDAKAAREELAEELRQKHADVDKLTSGDDDTSEAEDAKSRILRKRITDLEAQLSRFKISSDARGEDGQRIQDSLRPIFFQQNFGFLPRLIESGVRDPLPTNQPPRSLPPPKMPRTDLPPKAMVGR